MRNIHKWALGAVGLTALAGVAWAQVPATLNLTGNEIVRAALPGGGSDIAVPVYVLRNGRSLSTIAAGTTVGTSAVAGSGLLVATGAITTWNISLPVNPWNGQNIDIMCPGGTASTLTISASPTPTGQTIVGVNPTTCSSTLSPTGAGFTYQLSNKTWYRTQ